MCRGYSCSIRASVLGTYTARGKQDYGVSALFWRLRQKGRCLRVGYFYASKDYVAPALYSGKEYLASAVSLPVILPILSQAQWLRWLERITASAATDFDKALDSRYLETYIGGGNHRMLDGGHTLGGAWGNIAKMCGVAKCSTGEQVNGYLTRYGRILSLRKGCRL